MIDDGSSDDKRVRCLIDSKILSCSHSVPDFGLSAFKAFACIEVFGVLRYDEPLFEVLWRVGRVWRGRRRDGRGPKKKRANNTQCNKQVLVASQNEGDETRGDDVMRMTRRRGGDDDRRHHTTHSHHLASSPFTQSSVVTTNYHTREAKQGASSIRRFELKRGRHQKERFRRCRRYNS